MTTALNAGLRLASARPTAGSTSARYIAARSAASRLTAPRSAASRLTAPRSAASLFTPPRSVASLFTAPRSAASCFALPRSASSRFTTHPGAGGTRLLGWTPLRCAADAPPAAANTPPPPPLPSKWLKLWKELKPLGFSLLMFFISLGLGMMASKEDAKKTYTYIVTLCEKSEKIHKVLSHILPILMAIVKSFW